MTVPVVTSLSNLQIKARYVLLFVLSKSYVRKIIFTSNVGNGLDKSFSIRILVLKRSVKGLGIYIKSLVIHQITGGVVNFGNSIHTGSNETNKTVQDSEEETGETAPEKMPPLIVRFLF